MGSSSSWAFGPPVNYEKSGNVDFCRGIAVFCQGLDPDQVASHPLAITVALQELVSQGHDLNQLVDGYPASLVKGLLAASRLQRRYHLVEQAAAFSVAVAGALDLALNQGKGKVLEVWMGEILKEETDPSQERWPRMSAQHRVQAAVILVHLATVLLEITAQRHMGKEKRPKPLPLAA